MTLLNLMPVVDSANTIFQTAAAFINQTSRHLFLTGKAGTGKTTFLKHIKETSGKKMAIVAPTGVAAINAGGVTIHSLFQIPPGTYLPSGRGLFETSNGKIYNNHTLFKQMRMSADKKELLRELDLLIIDEVSMVRADLLDAIDTVLRHFRRQPLLPFGGTQVLYIGDLFQLPPVVINEEWDLLKDFYRSPFFFDAHIVQESPPVYIELKKIYRQSDDAFIRILNNIRSNCCTETDLTHLHNYYKPNFSAEQKDNYITLTTHNEKAIAINNSELRKLPDKLYQFKAEIGGEFNERSFPGEELLQLKKGAQVMFIKNDSGENRRYYNGKIGLIHSIDEKGIQIKFSNETSLLTLEKETWKNIRYHYQTEKDKIEEEELGTFTQYPIRLAWSITIHKSQGLTFDKAIVDAGSSFAPGQVYVALSRLTSLNGLVLKSRIYPHCIQTDERVLEFISNEWPEEVLHQALRKEQQQYIRDSMLQGFGWEKLLDTFREHHEEYGHRNLPNLNACITWSSGVIEKIKILQDTSVKFKKHLEQFFERCEEDNYKQLHERVQAAVNYFNKETDEKLLVSLNDHIKLTETKSKTRKYRKALYELKHQVERRKFQLQNLGHISRIMYESHSADDIVKAAEALQKPFVVEPMNEHNLVNKKLEKGETHRISLQMFKNGNTIPEIAKERNLTLGTIEGHLASFVVTGEVDILDIVNEIQLERILKLVKEKPTLTSSQLKKQLGDDYSYGQINAVMNYKAYRIETQGP
jgi:nucleoside-triphosphatase THEP1